MNDPRPPSLEALFDGYQKAADRRLTPGGNDYNSQVGIGYAIIALAIAVRGLWPDQRLHGEVPCGRPVGEHS